MVFETLLNPIFDPLLKMSPLLSIVIIALLISVIITVVYKYMTDQKKMKELKDSIKANQKKMKEFRHDQKKVMSLQKQAMSTNMEYMKHSMKPTLITFLPIIIIFGWLNANLAFEPIMPGQEFTTSIQLNEGITGKATIIVPVGIDVLDDVEKEIMAGMVNWSLKGEEGIDYLLEYDVAGTKYSKELHITDEQKYAAPLKSIKDGRVTAIMINNEKLRPLNIFGWELGWLGTYIICSIVFSMGLRKLMKLY